MSQVAWYEQFFEGFWFDMQRARYPGASAAGIAEAMCALLGLDAEARVLDVPCGTGIIALELVKRGIHVTGVDFSREALDIARESAAKGELDLELHCRDMRDLPFDAEFDAVVNYWGSFGYFDDEGDEAFVRAAYRSLKPGGRFLIEGPTAETLFPDMKETSECEMAGVHISEKRTYDVTTGRLHVEWTFSKDCADPWTRITDIRVYSCPELCALLRRAGFTSFEPFGLLTGEPFQIGARLNLVATK